MKALEAFIGKGIHDYTVVIASLDRPEELCTKALSCLVHQQKILEDRIDVCVADSTSRNTSCPSLTVTKQRLASTDFR